MKSKPPFVVLGEFWILSSDLPSQLWALVRFPPYTAVLLECLCVQRWALQSRKHIELERSHRSLHVGISPALRFLPFSPRPNWKGEMRIELSPGVYKRQEKCLAKIHTAWVNVFYCSTVTDFTQALFFFVFNLYSQSHLSLFLIPFLCPPLFSFCCNTLYNLFEINCISYRNYQQGETIGWEVAFVSLLCWVMISCFQE